ncbi:TPA: hypothetical protein ACNEW9_004854 [Escherichia coli]
MLEISASRISNVVTFTTDFKSLQKAKNEVDKLQKKMQGIKPVQVAAARQKDLQRLGKEIQRQHDQHVKQAVKSETQASKASTKQKLQEAKNLAKAQAKRASIASSALHHIASYKASRTIPAMAKGWILRNITMLYVTLRNKPASMNPALYRKRR